MRIVEVYKEIQEQEMNIVSTVEYLFKFPNRIFSVILLKEEILRLRRKFWLAR